MANKKVFPKRKKNRLENYDYSSCGAYFITVCTRERKNYFWTNVGAIIDRPQNIELSLYGKMVDNAIQNITSAYPALSLESYVIMPNHIHLLLRACADEYGRPLVAPTMSRVIKQLKGIVSKQAGISIWQKSFHDHIIRNREDYEEHLRYIYENPTRWYSDELFTAEQGGCLCNTKAKRTINKTINYNLTKRIKTAPTDRFKDLPGLLFRSCGANLHHKSQPVCRFSDKNITLSVSTSFLYKSARFSPPGSIRCMCHQAIPRSYGRI